MTVTFSSGFTPGDVLRGRCVRYLDAIVYHPTQDYHGSDTLSVTVDDKGNTGSDTGVPPAGTGGPNNEEGSGTVDLTVTSINDEPSGVDNTIVTDEDTAYTFKAADFGFTDPIHGNALSAVKITSLPADGTLSNDGVPVALNALVPVADVNGGLLKFEPAANASGGPYTTFTFQVQDDGGTASNGIDVDQSANTITVLVNALNDAPVNTTPVGPLTVAEDTDLAVTGLQVSDVDAGQAHISVTLSVANGTITVLDNVAGGLDPDDITGNGSNSVTLTCTIADINATLAAAGGVTYHGNPDFSGSDTLSMTSNDGGANGNDPGGADPNSEEDLDLVAIDVTAANDPVTSSAPATLGVDPDSSKAVTGLSIADVDATLAPAGQYSVTLSSTHGTLTLTTLTGVAFATGDGTADATMTFTGTLTDINTALDTASYTPTAGYIGSAEITILVTDQFGVTVATGAGAATSDSDTVEVAVTAVNDPVTASAPATATTFEGASVVISGLSIADVDATVPSGASGLYAVTLAATQGTMTLTTLAGLTFDGGDGTADATMTFHGTLSNINAALAGANYNAAANYNGAASLTICRHRRCRRRDRDRHGRRDERQRRRQHHDQRGE